MCTGVSGLRGWFVIGWYVGELCVDGVGQGVGLALVAVAESTGGRELEQLREGSFEGFVAEFVPAGFDL